MEPAPRDLGTSAKQILESSVMRDRAEKRRHPTHVQRPQRYRKGTRWFVRRRARNQSVFVPRLKPSRANSRKRRRDREILRMLQESGAAEATPAWAEANLRPGSATYRVWKRLHGHG